MIEIREHPAGGQHLVLAVGEVQAQLEQYRQHGRGDPVPGCIGDYQSDVLLVQEDDIVKIAPHTAPGAVQCLHAPAVDLRRLLGQQRSLDDLCAVQV